MVPFGQSIADKPGVLELMHLYSQISWAKERTVDNVQKLLDELAVFACLHLDGKLNGFSRVITDGFEVFRNPSLKCPQKNDFRTD